MIDVSMFKVSYAADAVKEGGQGGGQFIGESGIYDVTIKFASLDQTTNGAGQLNLNIEYNGNSQTIYGPILVKIDGTKNDIGARQLNKLLTIAGIPAGQSPGMAEETHNVGKEQKPRAFQVFTDLTDVEVKMKLKQVYTKYNGNISPKLELDSTFRMDSASSSEIASEMQGTEVTIGAQFKNVEDDENTTKPAYRDSRKDANDAPSPEEVAAWIAAGRPKAGATGAAPAAPTANVFAGGGSPANAFPTGK